MTLLKLPRLVIVILIIGITGCVSGTPLPRYENNQFSISKESMGVSVQIKPLSDKDSLQKYFGKNLVAAGIFPVYVKIENNTSGNSVLIDDKTFSIRVGVNSNESDSLSSSSAPDVPEWYALISGHLYVSATKTPYAYNQNRLQPTTLSPGKQTEGFVYFPLPEGEEIPNNWEIAVTIVSLSGENSIDLRFR